MVTNKPRDVAKTPVRRALKSGAKVVVGMLALAMVFLGVRFLIMNWPVNEEATINPALIEQGTVYSCSVGGSISVDRNVHGVKISPGRVGRDGQFSPGAELWLLSEQSGAHGWVPLGESLTAPDLGTVYLIGLSTFQGVQQVEVLFIPAGK